MTFYHDYASLLLQGKIVADCCIKPMGYPVFLAIIYYFFGQSNLQAVINVQILLDTICGLLVYLTALRLFSKKAAILSFIIYLINPLTSSFTGLKLAEILTIFFISLIAYILSHQKFTSNKFFWLFWGLLLGLLVFTRVQFLYFIYLVIPLLGIIVFKKMTRLIFILISSFGFLIASSYMLVANYENFKTISISIPYSPKWSNLYANFYLDFRWPELNTETIKNEEMKLIINEFWSVPLEYIPAFENNYKNLFFEKLKIDWPIYIKNSLRNMIWGWDKYHLSEFTDPYYPNDSYFIRIYNILLLLLFLVGFAMSILKKGKQLLRDQLILFTLLLFFYITIVFSLVGNESRHTLPFYPIIMLWAGNGLFFIQILFQKLMKKIFLHQNI
jgi:4-amino-4-deoxy-L-arabinose transferase-like glycosyltransferase